MDEKLTVAQGITEETWCLDEFGEFLVRNVSFYLLMRSQRSPAVVVTFATKVLSPLLCFQVMISASMLTLRTLVPGL